MQVSKLSVPALSKFPGSLRNLLDNTIPQPTAAFSAHDTAIPNSWVSPWALKGLEAWALGNLSLPPLTSLPMALETARVPLTLQQSM